MARDVVSRMQDKAGDVLRDGERYLGAQALTVRGRAALGAWAADADMETVMPNYVAQHGVVEELTVSDEAIPNAFLVAVTDARVLVFSRAMSGKPRELVEEHQLVETTLDVVDVGETARSRLFVFGMASGAVFAGACPINGKARDAADRFVDAWTHAESHSMS